MKTVKPRILVALDFSETSRRALDWAVHHAVATKGEIHVVHAIEYRLADLLPVVEDMRMGVEMDQLKTVAQTELDRVLPRELRGELAPPIRHVALGPPANEILRVAESIQADMIVLGSHGRTGIGRFLLGSVAEKVLRHANGIVVCIKPDGKR